MGKSALELGGGIQSCIVGASKGPGCKRAGEGEDVLGFWYEWCVHPLLYGCGMHGGVGLRRGYDDEVSVRACKVEAPGHFTSFIRPWHAPGRRGKGWKGTASALSKTDLNSCQCLQGQRACVHVERQREQAHDFASKD